MTWMQPGASVQPARRVMAEPAGTSDPARAIHAKPNRVIAPARDFFVPADRFKACQENSSVVSSGG